MNERNNPAISVIIPLYNAEKYISECLASLANQTFQDFEIIVVDDCSADNSIEVAQKFFTTFDNRLILMKFSRNSGCPGIPRNFALEEAHGKYVYFLDSDDLLSETALEELYNVAEKFNADVVHAGKYFAFSDEKRNKITKVTHNKSEEFMTEPTLETFDVGKRIENFTRKKYLWWACNKLFRRQFLTDNKIKFAAIRSFEDFVFVFECIVMAKNYVRVPFMSYYYRVRKDSLSHRSTDSIEESKTMIEVVAALDSFMNTKKFFHENFQYRYMILDFFIQSRLELITKGFFVLSDIPPEMVFNFFRAKIFSANPEENVSLTAYLFVAMNIFKLYSNQQASEIADLKAQLAALQK